MKKLFYFAAAAVALAACAKNEVVPVNSGENQEITFNVAPKTKAATKFADNLKFKSYAYYLPGEETWDNHKTDPALYINGAEISYQKKTADSEEKVWKAEHSYYWPKNGKLTFFAWTSLKETVGNPNSYTVSYVDDVTCSNTTGIKVENYKVDSEKNKNVDLLVADIKADQKANTTTTEAGKYYNNGVPTLFRHKLSYLIFKVKTATDDYASAGKEFALKSIKILGVDSKGTYSQNATTTNSDGSYNTVGSWEVTASKTAQTYFDVTDHEPVVFGAADITLESDNKFKGSVKQKYYLPQTIDAISGDPSSKTNYTIEVVYTIKTTELNPTTSTSTETTETVTKYIKASEIYGEKWEINKKYTCTLTFSLNEILWDPAVENWDEVDVPTSGLTI